MAAFQAPEIDMLHGPLCGKLLRYTLPIALSSILQQLFQAADTAVVGRFASADALAAVGTNTETTALIVTVSAGLAVGANVLVARQIGTRRQSETAAAVRAALLLAVLLGAAAAGFGQMAVRPLLRAIQTPERIFRGAETYLRLYLLGCPGLLVYDFGAAVLRARGNSRDPFLALAFSGVVNVGLNLFFVTALRMDVAGVAVATDLSNLLSAGMVLGCLTREHPFRPAVRSSRGGLSFAGEILKVGLPAAVQGAVFCGANLFVQAAVNGFGETVIAGNTIAMNFEYFTYYIITAFGQAATTFTTQNHAAMQWARCRKVLWLCLGLFTLCSGVPIFTLVLFRTFFAGLFTPEQAVIESATARMLGILLFEPVCNLYEVPAGSLRGSGHALYPAVCTTVGTCVFRIVWLCTAFRKSHTLSTLYRAFPFSWAVTILLVDMGVFLIGRWERKRRT